MRSCGRLGRDASSWGQSERRQRLATSATTRRSPNTQADAFRLPAVPVIAQKHGRSLRRKFWSAGVGAESPRSRLQLARSRLAPGASGWLDPAVDPDPRPSAEMRACGEHQGRCVGGENTCFAVHAQLATDDASACAVRDRRPGRGPVTRSVRSSPTRPVHPARRTLSGSDPD
jgi:hypothetical protein